MPYTTAVCAMHPATSAGLLAPSLDLKPIAAAQVGMKRAGEIIQARNEARPFRLYKEARKLFSRKDSVTMNFVPQMLNAAAMQLTLEICDHCAKRRHSELKHATRGLKRLVNLYAEHLSDVFGSQVSAYNYFIRRYWDEISLENTQTGFTVLNLVNRLHPDCVDRELAARCWITRGILAHAESVERRWDAEVDRRFKRHIRRRRDRALTAIDTVLAEIEKAIDAPVPTGNADLQLCMRVLENKAHYLAVEALEEEEGDEEV